MATTCWEAGLAEPETMELRDREREREIIYFEITYMHMHSHTRIGVKAPGALNTRLRSYK